MGRFTDIQDDVIRKYRITIDEHSACWGRTHAHVRERRVCKWKQKNSVQSTFELLHEVGHIVSNKSGMRRCEQEYHATVWAIERAKEYGLTIPKETISDYQDYINRELDRGVRRHGQNYNKEYVLTV